MPLQPTSVILESTTLDWNKSNNT